jgi:hypothetical protein
MKRWLPVVALSALGACPGKSAAPTTGSQGTVTVAPTSARTCDEVRPRVEQLYRAEAQVKEPTRVDEAVADNTAMAMTDCAKDPATAVPCLASVPTVAELEKRCLVPLDDEGTEGDALRK